MTALNARTPLVTPAMLWTLALLASAPFWVNRVGLYPYLALEIMI
jgi:branched-chain amino acid transport system permease protein